MWRERIIILFIAAITMIPTVVLTRQSVQHNALTGFSVYTASRGAVHVSGDLLHPGMYPITANTMTDSVIKMAVPVARVKRLVPAALATQQISNGDDLHLEIGTDGQGWITITPMPASERIVMGIPLNINTMAVSDLVIVPGIGPATARRIVEYRQNNGGFMTPEELMNVNGIGEKKYGKIKKYF